MHYWELWSSMSTAHFFPSSETGGYTMTLYSFGLGKFHEKFAILLDFVQIISPPLTPQFGQLVQLFLNAKNVNFSDLQNDSLSKKFPK